MKDRLLRFKQDLEDSHIKLKMSSDLPSTKDASNAQIKEMLRHAAEAGNISAAYGSANPHDYSRSGQEDSKYYYNNLNRLSRRYYQS